MDKDFLVLLNIGRGDLGNRKNFQAYLEESGSSEILKKKALKIYDLKRKKKSQEQLVDKFAELSELKLEKNMTPEKYKALYFYQKFVENLDKDHPLRHLVELGIALRTNNKTWVKKVSQRIATASALQYAVFMNPTELSGKYKIKLIESIYSTLSLMKKEFKDPMLLRILATRFNSLLPSKYKEKFESNFNSNWSLNELREITGSRLYGQFSVGLWFNVLENRTTEAEVNRFLDTVLRRSALRKLPKQDYWILKYFYPGDERRQKLEAKLASVVKKDTGVHDKLILSEILEREPIKKSMAKVDPALGRPLFKIKREIYKDVLNTGNPSEFALYNLFLLGEKDPELFWWFVL